MINISVESGASGIVISITGISVSSTANPAPREQSSSVRGAGSLAAAAGPDKPGATVAPSSGSRRNEPTGPGAPPPGTGSGVIVIGPIVIPGAAVESRREFGDHIEPTGPGVTVIGPIVIPGSPEKPPDHSADHLEGTGPGGL